MFEVFLAFNRDYLTYGPKVFTSRTKANKWITRQNGVIAGKDKYYLDDVELDPIEIKN